MRDFPPGRPPTQPLSGSGHTTQVWLQLTNWHRKKTNWNLTTQSHLHIWSVPLCCPFERQIGEWRLFTRSYVHPKSVPTFVCDDSYHLFSSSCNVLQKREENLEVTREWIHQVKTNLLSWMWFLHQPFLAHRYTGSRMVDSIYAFWKHRVQNGWFNLCILKTWSWRFANVTATP